MVGDQDNGYDDLLGKSKVRDTVIQVVLSGGLGFFAFFTFCFWRPRWPSLYAARKKNRDQASPLPDLPDTLFGWIPVLWSITDQQVLASGGLDAYVFLRFFRMAIKFLTVTLFFALVVIKPVHDAFPDPKTPDKNATQSTMAEGPYHFRILGFDDTTTTEEGGGIYEHLQNDYLWMYLVFAYLFTGLATYLIVTETKHVIGVRQEYLGSQSTITDRTFRLSGIPPGLQDENKIKDFVQDLEIGKVESVMLCRNWERLDVAVECRMQLLRKLEESWTVFLGKRRIERSNETLPISQPPPPGPDIGSQDEENDALLGSENGSSPANVPYARSRPKMTLRYGFLKLRSKYIDAIDYYEERLRRTDEEINELRKKQFDSTPVAFVTMDSVASCQMAIQAVLDPSPMQLIAHASPASSDVVWRNTYLPRSRRMTYKWTITIIITLLTVFWSLLLVPIAGSLNPKTIKKVWNGLGTALEQHSFVNSLVTTQLPTLLSTLLFVAVPYLYDWLANQQGMISQGDVELSVITKNFFFLFYNYFVVFTILSTLSNSYEILQRFRDSLTNTPQIAFTLAKSLQKSLGFYVNLIVLQGLGLFPLRLLEVGSVMLYPIYRMGVKTPRDYAELVQPPVFNYGFYLPQVMLIFIICIVYSVLRDSWRVLLAGLVYFILGSGVYKYQLLYAMDHRQHSTGKAWIMICNRTLIGLVLFQLTTAGQLALKRAYTRAALIVPLIIATIWFSYSYSRSYSPLMNFISLRSIERQRPPYQHFDSDPDGWADQDRLRYEAESHSRDTAENPETRSRYVNPSLVAPLEDVWIADKAARASARASSPQRRLTTMLNAL